MPPRSNNALVTISRRLASEMDLLDIGKSAAFTYNPLEYARIPHEKYLKTYGAGKKEVLLLGMNPGPFGMAQTGVPFGDVSVVRDWMGITGKVDHPKNQHPKRPILGFDCTRSEVSGTRLYGFASDRFGSAEKFFERFFVVNFCPLVFMEEGGKNLTPDKLPKNLQTPLFSACEQALRDTVELLKPRWVLGVGAFAQKRAESALKDFDGRIGTILHPSPASPRANRGWASEVENQLRELGIALPRPRV